ncbi:MAG: polysaccharide export protein [Sphingomonadales bacterium]|nr:polysaccharide export protein [Sphingomonadales bacterium]
MVKSTLALLALVMVALSGCAGTPSPLADSGMLATSYALSAGDKLRITVYSEPALTGEYAINSAGNVAFPLIGDIPAANGPVEKLADAITAKLARGYVKDPRVSVEVLNYRPYYILGEVNKPGGFPYSVNLTIEQAVAAAGGYSYRANRRYAIVRRANEPEEHSVDLRGRPSYVLPGDTIRISERYF